MNQAAMIALRCAAAPAAGGGASAGGAGAGPRSGAPWGPTCACSSASCGSIRPAAPAGSGDCALGRRGAQRPRADRIQRFGRPRLRRHPSRL